MHAEETFTHSYPVASLNYSRRAYEQRRIDVNY